LFVSHGFSKVVIESFDTYGPGERSEESGTDFHEGEHHGKLMGTMAILKRLETIRSVRSVSGYV